MIIRHRYDAHGRFVANLSRPSEVTLAFVVLLRDTFAVSAAIASTHRNALRSRVVDIWYEIVVTNAMIRADAVAVLAVPVADRLAEAVVLQCEAVVALATIRRRARAVEALWVAEGYAKAVRVPRVASIANANAGFVARPVTSARRLI